MIRNYVAIVRINVKNGLSCFKANYINISFIVMQEEAKGKILYFLDDDISIKIVVM